MHVGNIPLQNLWELEVLGIIYPTETVKEREDLSDFREKMRILPEGRYEVELPLKSNLMNLCDNKELAWKREWESMNIIECVPEIELNNKCHYLPHRPVIKLNSQTTKVRPVFDAPASKRVKLSLNECLHKGINLLEMIP
ncbi:DUF1758 domain-containing protein [Trichonephila clavipes]|nr:DUF1758 domain-containing protein [Trichonephila clavipes]